MSVAVDVKNGLAPTGVLRASINVGNPVLAQRAGASAAGVSVDLATALAAELGVEVALTVFDAARESVGAVERGAADIGFFAVDPIRAAEIAFTAPYVLIEGAYLVRTGSHVTANEDIDHDGHSVVVGKGSAYDLYLTRALKQARIDRVPTSAGVVDAFLATGADAAAGVRQQLEADAGRVPGVRVLPGRFMVIEQAMGVRRDRGAAAVAYLSAFVQARKADGFVAAALRRHGIEGASVAP